MFRIRFNDLTSFHTFLTVNVSESIDVIINDSSALFVINSNELFVMYSAKCIDNEKSAKFCFSRDEFKSAFCDGDVVLDDSSDLDLVTEFHNAHGALVWSMKTQKRQVFDVVYSDKLGLLKDVQKYPCVTVADIGSVQRIAKSGASTINFDCGMVGVCLKSGERVYKNVECKESFCLTSDSFDTLKKCNSKFYVVHEYIVAGKGQLAVIANGITGYSNMEFDTACGANSIYKAKYVGTFDIQCLLKFLGTHKVADARVTVSLVTKSVKIVNNGTTYVIPIGISEETIAPGATFNEFTAPLSLFSKILGPVSASKFKLKKKKTFIEISFDDQYVLFS